MRNLAQYPITAEEAQRVLTRAVDKALVDLAPGDTGPYCLKKVSQFLDLHAAEFDVWIIADTAAMMERVRTENQRAG